MSNAFSESMSAAHTNAGRIGEGARRRPAVGKAPSPSSSEQRLRPIFVVGYPRSGTTLLFRNLVALGCFGDGPSYADPGDHAIETAIGLLSNPLLDFASILAASWPQWDRALPTSADRAQFLAAAKAANSIGGRAWEAFLGERVFGDRHLEAARTDLDDLHQRVNLPGHRGVRRRFLAVRASRRSRIIQAFMQSLARSHGTSQPVEKYPFHYLVMPELLGAFPNARFVFISRRPADVYRSLVRRARIDINRDQPIGATSWMTMSAPAFAYDWNRSAACFHAIKTWRPNNILHLRYEDLTEDLPCATQALEAFLGVSAGLRPTASSLGDPTRRFFFNDAIPVRNSGEHLPDLHPADQATIFELTEKVAAALGHDS